MCVHLIGSKKRSQKLVGGNCWYVSKLGVRAKELLIGGASLVASCGAIQMTWFEGGWFQYDYGGKGGPCARTGKRVR